MPVQKFNDQNAALLATVFQQRYESNFALAEAASTVQGLPALRGYWPFSATESGAITDLSGQGRILAAMNGLALGSAGLAQYGSFDGVNDYAIRPDEAGLRVTAGLSMAGWFYFGVGTTLQGLLSKWYDTGNQRGYRLFRSATDYIQAQITPDGVTGTIVTSSATVANSAWLFIGFRFEPSTSLSVFINGTWTDNTTAIPASIYASTEAFEIGRINRADYLTGRAALCWLAAEDLPKAEFETVYHCQRALFGV